MLNLLKLSERQKHTVGINIFRTLRQSVISRKEATSVQDRAPELNEEENELYLDALKEEEIERKRNKNRLPERVYKNYVKKEGSRPELKYDFTRNRLRTLLGRFGLSTGLNPGILWPTKKELENLIEHDSIFHPPLKDTLAKIAAEEAAINKERQEYEKEVEENLVKADKLVVEYYARIAKKERETEELKKKRESLVEEISEYLGYEVNPNDPRFKEAVDLKEKEKKKVIKEAKQKENYNKMLEKLVEIANKEK